MQLDIYLKHNKIIKHMPISYTILPSRYVNKQIDSSMAVGYFCLIIYICTNNHNSKET